MLSPRKPSDKKPEGTQPPRGQAGVGGIDMGEMTMITDKDDLKSTLEQDLEPREQAAKDQTTSPLSLGQAPSALAADAQGG